VTSTSDSAENKPVSTRVFRETESPEAFRINSGLIRTCAEQRVRIKFISGFRGGMEVKEFVQDFFSSVGLDCGAHGDEVIGMDVYGHGNNAWDRKYIGCWQG